MSVVGNDTRRVFLHSTQRRFIVFFLKKVYSYITELNISGLNNLDFFIGGVQSEQSNAVKHIFGQPFEENLSPRRYKNSPIWSHCT